MSENISSDHNQQPVSYIDLIENFVPGSKSSPTYERFSFANVGSTSYLVRSYALDHAIRRVSDVVYRKNDADREPKRYLFVTFDNSEELMEEIKIYQTLMRNGVPCPRLAETEINDVIAYELPAQSKPLVQERLFVGKESSETYIADTEIYKNLGNMLAQTYNACRRLPLQPLDSTALVDFSDNQGVEMMLVPPYTNWDQLTGNTNNPHHALSALEHRVERQISKFGFRQPYRPLLSAINDGWESWYENTRNN